MEQELLLKVLPQRDPMRMVDDILELQQGISVTGYKKVLEDEVWAKGHFPGEPIFPGVLLIEHMAQVMLFLAYDERKEPTDRPYLAKVDQVKFLAPVLPGMELYTDVKVISEEVGFIKGEATVYIGKERKQKAAKGKLTCYVGQRSE